MARHDGRPRVYVTLGTVFNLESGDLFTRVLAGLGEFRSRSWRPSEARSISPAALRRSFEQSQHVVIARDGDRVVGMARLLSDGVCNAYLVDVWTQSSYAGAGSRRR